MGSSELAGTKGKPATPRDGSAVEIVGLSKSALGFLGRMHHEGHFSYNSVERCDETGVWEFDTLYEVVFCTPLSLANQYLLPFDIIYV